MRNFLAAFVAVFVIGLGLVLWVPSARAQAEPADRDADLTEEIEAANAEAGAKQKPEVAEAAEPKAIVAVVRGFYLEMKVGGGYALVDQPIDAAASPGIPAGSEGLGLGAVASLAAGYDITEMIAIQLVGGAAMVAGNRADYVRDLGLIYVGAQARVAIDFSNRLDFVAAGGAGFVSADNAVEKAEHGIGIVVDAGIEYYVHVRHFSIGININMVMPVMPVRMFLGLSPTLKYTF